MNNIIVEAGEYSNSFEKIFINNLPKSITITKSENLNFVFSAEDNNILQLKIAEIISEYILCNLESALLKKIILSDYSYFEFQDKNNVFKSTEMLLSNSGNDICKTLLTLKRRFLIRKDVVNFLLENNTINLSGFITFRLCEYKKMLSDLIENVIKDYRLQKEYKEFISMLKFFVDTQKNRCNRLHIIIKNSGIYTILNEFNVDITDKCFDEFAEVKKEKEINNEDLLISSLITLAPKKIFLHFESDNYNKKIIKTIEQVFENKVFFNPAPALELVR